METLRTVSSSRKSNILWCFYYKNSLRTNSTEDVLMSLFHLFFFSVMRNQGEWAWPCWPSHKEMRTWSLLWAPRWFQQPRESQILQCDGYGKRKDQTCATVAGSWGNAGFLLNFQFPTCLNKSIRSVDGAGVGGGWWACLQLHKGGWTQVETDCGFLPRRFLSGLLQQKLIFHVGGGSLWFDPN